jgi:hypothetical protein
MGCLVLVSPTRGLGPAETSYSFQLTLSLKTGKIQENNEAVKNKASQFPFAVWKSFSFNEKHKEGMNGKNEGKDGQLKK